MDEKKKNEKDVNSMSFFDKIIEIFTGIKSEERLKLKKLKEINKDLSSLKFKFYNYKNDVILPALSTYFYDIYRNSQVLNRYFDVKNHSKSIKEFLFDSAISSSQKSLKEKLEREKIIELIKKSQDPAKAIESVKGYLKEFVQSFDSTIINKINTTYNQIVNLSYLINFDWFFVVHKIDTNISETNIDYKPSFDPLDAKYLIDELVEINDYLLSNNMNDDFDGINEYLKSISQDSSLIDVLKKLINQFRIIKRDDYLTKIIQLVHKDPFFVPKNFSSNERIIQDYVNSFQQEIKTYIEECIREINKEKVNKILMEIFNTTIILRMKFYSQKINDFLLNKGIMGAGLKYIDPLNYIKAYLLDICKGEIKSRIDLLIIKGTWVSNAVSSEYTEILDKINKFTTRVVEFDERCSDEGQLGKEIKRLGGVLKHDKNAQGSLKKTLANIDTEAARIIFDCISLTIEIGKSLKNLIEDFNQKTPKVIINFHKIKWEFTAEFNEDMIAVYKKLVNMVTLLKRYVSEKPQEDKED